MANQVTVQVYAIDNIPQRNALNVSFPTGQISAQLATSVLASNIQSQINYYPNPNNQAQLTEVLVSQSISDIATLASNSMFAASIYKINGYPQGGQALSMLFPSVQPSIWNVSGGGDVHSFVQFKGKKYYAHETSAALATAANAGDSGGGGLALESYQNSAMSAAVMAYVYRDESNNIFSVYEPIRNNRVYRNQYAYADSIDLFPFDSVNCFNNILNDVKLIGLNVADILLQGNILNTLIINANSHTGFVFTNNTATGNYGVNTPNIAEFYISGDTVVIDGNTFGRGGGFEADHASYIDSVGANSQIVENDFLTNTKISCAGFSLGFFYLNMFTASSRFTLHSNLSDCETNIFMSCIVDVFADVEMFNNQFNQECIVSVYNAIEKCYVGSNVRLSTLDSAITSAYIGDNTGKGGSTFTPSADNNYLSTSPFAVKAGNPTITEIPNGNSAIFDNGTDIRIYVNNGGAILKSAAFTA